MIWFILEGSVALLLFVFIIWWTLPRKRDVDKHNDQDSNPTLTADKGTLEAQQDAEDAEERQKRGKKFES